MALINHFDTWVKREERAGVPICPTCPDVTPQRIAADLIRRQGMRFCTRCDHHEYFEVEPHEYFEVEPHAWTSFVDFANNNGER